MTYASMLVAVEEGAESDSRLELACDLAIAFDALLIGLSVGSVAPPFYDPLAGGAMIGELLTLYRDIAESDVERARLRFSEITTARGLETEWRGGVGYPAEFVSQAARAADHCAPAAIAAHDLSVYRDRRRGQHPGQPHVCSAALAPQLSF